MYDSQFNHLFHKMDCDRSGELTIQELEHNLELPDVQAYFSHLDLDIHQAWDIFRMIDEDRGGTLSTSEFVTGCLRLRGVTWLPGVNWLSVDAWD